MIKQEKAIRRAELLLIFLLLAAILVPQFLGGGSSPSSSQDSEGDIHSLEDLKDKTFVTVLSSSFSFTISELYPDAPVNYVTDWSEECIQVQKGMADATLWEASSLQEVYDQYPDLFAIPEPVAQMEYSWATQKDEKGEKLRQEINAFIRQMEGEGLLDEIYARWADIPNAPDHVDSSPMTGEPQGVLRVVSCPDWQPVCYLNGSNLCGYMIELLDRFCAWAGYTPEIELVDFLSTTAGMAAGRYDLLVYGLEAQAETSEKLNFTDPLMREDVFALISRDRWAGEGSDSAAAVDHPPRGFWEQISQSFERTFIREERWRMFLSGLQLTVALSLFSVLFGTLLGGLICAMSVSRRALPVAFARIYTRWMQGMPIVLTLLLLYYVILAQTGISAFWVCVLGFSLDFSAYAGEMFRSSIRAVPPGQTRAGRALGFSPAGTFRYIVFPQMVIHCLPVYIGQIITTVKLTSVAGYISVVDLTRVSDLIRARTYETFFPLIVTAIIYFLVAWGITLLLKQLERRIDPMLRKRQIKGVNAHVD